MMPQVIRPRLKVIAPACHDNGDAGAETAAATEITAALVGQPNVGKSTVFNMLTGLSQHVGNWPGKTVEQKTGVHTHNGIKLRLVDLPGAYSLTANSEEERIARDYLLRGRPDVAIVVVNAAALERNLYLVAELLAMGQPLVLGLNMLDVARQHGIQVEPHVLQAALGAPVVPIVATKNQGMKELMETAIKVAQQPETFTPCRPTIRPEHEPVLAVVSELIAGHIPAPYPAPWVALKLLEGDAEMTALAQAALPPASWQQLHALLLEHEDAYLDIAGGRYEWIGRMVRAAITRPKSGAITRTEWIDRVATHPLAGLALLLMVLGLAFWLTYTVATPIAEWVSTSVLDAFDAAAAFLLGAAPPWLFGLVSNGLIHGVGTVFAFLPILVIFFAVLAVLEDVGYLARGAYVMDRFMHLMGLHGKSFMPLFLGFGCNVPAVLGARIIEERRARLLTILLAPLVPCTARLAVLAFLAPAFFLTAAPIVSLGLVGLNLIVLAVAGIAVNRLAFRGEQTAFIMELPLYHAPNLRTVGLYVWHNTLSFVKKAGTLILLASMAVWALSSFPGPGINDSVLAAFGRSLAPLGQLMGLDDWRLLVALLTSFFAKENTIATLGILYNLEAESASLAAAMATALAPAARLAFLVVVMLFIPCLATAATIQQETRSWRWTAAAIGLTLALSIVAGVIVYQVGARIM